MDPRCLARPSSAILIATGLLLSACLSDTPTEPAPSLTPGQTVDGRLEPGEERRFAVTLDAGQGLEIDLEQLGADVILEVRDPGGSTVSIDSPLGSHGREHLCWAASVSGAIGLRLAVFSGARRGGAYRLSLGPLRDAGSGDLACRRASESFFTAEALRLGDRPDPRQQVELYRRASELWKDLPDHGFERALALRQVGYTLGAAGDTDGERESLRRALESIRDSDHPGQEGVLYNLLGLNLLYSGRSAEAAAAFDRALERARTSRRLDVEASALNNQALLAENAGDLHRAVELYDRALSLWRSLDDPWQAALTLYNLGGAQAQAGRFGIARALLEQALLEHRALGNLPYLAASESAIGWMHHLEGDPDEAASRLQRALETARRSGDPRRQAEALDRLGSVHRELGDLVAARAAYSEAIELAEEIGNLRDLAHSTVNLGQLLIEMDQPAEGRRVLERALPTLTRLGDRDALAHLHACLAEAERRLGRLESARQALERALELVGSVRARTRDRGFFERPFAVRREYAERHVDLLVELARSAAEPPVRAFEIADLARARSFHEMLLESEIDPFASADPQLLERARRIRDQLDAVRGSGEAASEELETLLFELERAEAEIRRTNPRAAEIAFPTPLEIEAVRSHLAAGTLLLSYSLGEERSFLFTLTAETLGVHPLPSRRVLEELTRRVYRGLSRAQLNLGRHQFALDRAALSRLLLEPAAAELQNASQLLVVAEGGLLYLPFAALALPGGELVVDRLDVVHLPLVAALPALARRQAARPAPEGFLAMIADPVFDATDPRLGAEARSNVLDRTVDPPLPRLPASGREARAILDLVGERPRHLALGFTARKDLVTSGQLGTYRHLHFATHALLDDEHPEMSRLVLSHYDETGRRVDGALPLHQIFALDLPADLVVLSACRTALGHHHRGEGIVGLTRGFFYAGASRLLVSLWSVPDEPTAELMIEFYRRLLRDEAPPAAALRSAQLELRRRHPDLPPHAWAGFVLQGLP